MAPLLLATGLGKTFGATQALADVDLTLARGERLAVLGENGAGKSTLIKIVAGVYPQDVGEMWLDGEPYRPTSPADALRAGVSIVHQEPSFFGRLTVLENLFVGREPRDRLGQVAWSRMRQRAHRLFERLDLPTHLVSRRMETLSLAEQQLVLIARAVDVDARVLILDEPTSILTDNEAKRLFRVTRQLADDGVGILYITHRFDELEHTADRFLVLKDGMAVGDLPAAEADHDQMLELMSGRSVDALVRRGEREPGEVALDVTELTVPGAVESATLQVRNGEVVGLYGLVGSGRTELALAVFGMLRPSAGTMRLHGRPHRPKRPRDAMRAGIAYLPEDRKLLGLFPGMDVRSNLTAAVTRTLTGRLGGIRRAAERAVAGEWIDRLRIKAPTQTTPVDGLSGGHQQKVLYARQLATDPSLLVLDEPTRGIDVATKADIQRRIVAAADRGLAVLVISSELPEVLAVADRVYVLREGRVVAHLTGSDLTEDAVLRPTMGVTG